MSTKKKKDEEVSVPAGDVDITSTETADEELDAAELKRQSDEIEAKKKKAQSENGERLYNATEVKAMLEQVLANARGEGVEKKPTKRVPEVRMPRFQGKFIIGFKNVNTDEFFQDKEIFSFDVWDDKIKQNVAWVTVIFDDKTELNVPLQTAVQKSRMVKCELVETVKHDASYSIGKVERQEVEEYRMKGTGQTVDMEVKQYKYTYKVKLPHTGEIVEVQGDIINW